MNFFNRLTYFSGGFIIGVKKVPPIPPKLEIVMDPPKNSFLFI